MLPHKHIAISTLIGVVGWWGTGDSAAAVAAIVGGVLPDVDHVVDYSYYYWRREHRLILPLHGYEFAIFGAGVGLLTGNIFLGIAVISYLIHLLSDQAENRTHILGYSLLFRVRHRFRIENISTMPDAAARGRVDDIRSLKKLLNSLRER
jgi:hypothetical protein